MTIRRALLTVALLVASLTLQAAPIRRVVSLVPATTEILFAIGASDRLVGVGSYDNYPPEATKLPRLGGLLDPDVERLLALKPDLVVVYSTQSELRRQLEAAGIPTFLYVHRGLPDVTQTIRTLGARVEAKQAADNLADRINAQLADIRSRVAGRPRPRTLLVIGREAGSLRGVSASGGYGFLHDMLEVAGATDVLADIERESVQVSNEMILARAPDVIIELHYGADARVARIDAERKVWDRLGSLPAVKNHRVHLLVGDEFVVPGPRVVDATRKLAQTLHPDVFK
jgi:iron complex transport system substrate-binding protein